ncbi:tetratricopeptide repeat protein [Luteimonas sp. SDU82]|uniref:tetratricopeptide repeat protein n=1 Tax=Luteimonas sp. SDU82 TaxID=3422592 RepID=UPI003EB7B4EE
MQEQILEALRRGAADEALALAQALLDAEPQAARSHRMLAAVLQARGDREGAIAAVETALGIDPEDADAHFQRGVILGGARDLSTASDALSEAIRLDPNQFAAYILQAQIALGRGDLDEAARLSTLAARLEPDHPWLGAVEGMVALGRGRSDEALAILSQAAGRAPDDPQVLLPLALAYIAKGHHAFAEQALRKLVDDHGGALPWRLLLAETLARQTRPADGLEVLAPALVDVEAVAPAVLRLAGELELAAGRPAEALPWLRRSLLAMPHDGRALRAAMSAWQQVGDRDDARTALDELLAASPQSSNLWRARLGLESDDAARARSVIARWVEVAGDAPEVLEARMAVALRSSDEDEALSCAHALAARVPGSAPAHSVIVQVLQRRDPAQAVAHVSALLPQASDERQRDTLGNWLALLEDGAGLRAEAAARWEALCARRVSSMLPLPPVSLPADQTDAGPLPEAAAQTGERIDTLFLWGPPGSCVENVASMLSGVRGFRSDRLTAAATADVFQRFDSIMALSSGELDPAQAARDWRNTLQARGVDGTNAIEWLLWWDNALLRVLRPHVPDGALLFVVRDPRDMLLQWAAFGSPMQLAMPSLMEAAWWLERRLVQLIEASSLYRAALLRIDGSESDEAALAAQLTQALGMPLAATGRPLSRMHFAAGHWRHYTGAMAEPFALLGPVAKALGYPED